MNFSRNAILEHVPRELELDVTLWDYKHDLEKQDVLEKGDEYVFNAQYLQRPRLSGGTMFKDKYWRYYDVLPADIILIRIYADTAQKTAEHNDYSVLQCWAKSASTGIYLIDQCRGKWEAPALESQLISFWNKHKPSLRKPLGAQMIKIEDKSSGSSLIQSIKHDYNIPIEGIQRNTDKVFRAMGVVKFFSSGHVHLPKNADFLFDYKKEFSYFSPLMTHKNDDQIDPTMDAVEDLLVFEDSLYTGANI